MSASWQTRLTTSCPLLLIDDDALISMTIGDQLEDSGRFAVTVIDAFPHVAIPDLKRQVAGWVRANPGGVVVSDQQRPNRTGGIERYGNLMVGAAREAGFRGPAIIFSAGHPGQESIEARQAGADAFVTKIDGARGILNAVERIRGNGTPAR